MNKSHKKANCSTEEEWIRCKSKNHQGRFYLFNKSTGESKWVSNDKELGSAPCEEDCSKETNKPDSPPKVKRLKTPAQDRLKRLQNNFPKKPKIAQKQRTNSKNINRINIKNKTEPTKEEAVKNRAVDQKRASVKEQMPSFNAAVKKEAQIKQDLQKKAEIPKQNKKLKVETARPSAKKESPQKYSTVRNNSRSAREKATKRNFLEQDINQTIPGGKLAKTARGASTSKGSSAVVINEPEDSNSPGLGIIDKIKSFCRSTFSINSKQPPVAAKPVPKPILKIARKATNKRKAESQCASSSPKMRNPVPKPIGITTSPPMHNTPKNLVIPSYEPGSANLRLERLRKSIITQPSIRSCIEDTISISTTTTISTSGACNNNSLSEDYEPMDWQSIEDESEMPVEINNINSSICTRSSITFNYKNHEFASSSSSSSSSNEYCDIVNENLLRFSAEQQKTIRNGTQKWLGDHYYFVIDTNILLHQITFVEDLAEMKLCDTSGTIIFIPYIVLQELDKLKIRSSSESAKVLTVRAIRYLNSKFEERNKHIYAQSASDERQHLIDITSPDDSILNCCLQVKQQVENVVLLTEDVNLRNKAICNNILVSTKSDLVSKHASSVSAVKSKKYQ